jgi:hypothetical protein
MLHRERQVRHFERVRVLHHAESDRKRHPDQAGGAGRLAVFGLYAGKMAPTALNLMSADLPKRGGTGG